MASTVHIRRAATLAVALVLSVLLTSCGSSGGSSAASSGPVSQTEAATSSILVRLPSSAKRTQSAIPTATATFEIRILNALGTFDLVPAVRVPATETQVVIGNVPVGVAIVLIRSLDVNGAVLAEGRSTTVVTAGGASDVAIDLVVVTPTPTPSPSPPPPPPPPPPGSTPFLVVGALGVQELITYPRNADTGQLTDAPHTIALSTSQGALTPTGQVSHPTLGCVYVCGSSGSFRIVLSYAVDRNGALTSLGSEQILESSAGEQPESTITINPQGTRLYAVSGSTLYTLDIDANGALQNKQTFPIAETGAPYVCRSVAINPNNETLYICSDDPNATGTVVMQRDAQQGNGFVVIDVIPTPSQEIPVVSIPHPSGKTLYLLDTQSGSDRYLSFQDLLDDGRPDLNAPGGVSRSLDNNVLGQVNDLKAPPNPDDNVLYLSGLLKVGGFELDPTSKHPTTPLTPVTAGSSFGGLAIDPLSAFLYVASLNNNNVNTFSIETTGALANPTSLQLDPSTTPQFVTVLNVP